jgi:hypothetical protein
MSTDVAVPSAEDVAAAQAVLAQATAAATPARYKVVVSDPAQNDRVLFSSMSEKRTKQWVEQHVPRGEDVFVLSPDGAMSSYAQERTIGPKGEDVEPWQSFDRTAYSRPELHTVSAHDPWADAWEGAQ